MAVTPKRAPLIMSARRMVGMLKSGKAEPLAAARLIDRLSRSLEVDRRKPRVAYPDSLEVTSARGGSYVRISPTGEDGMIELTVGESCVNTVRTTLSVSGLAVILTAARDKGFQKVVDEYLAQGGGHPTIDAHRELHPIVPVKKRRGRPPQPSLLGAIKCKKGTLDDEN